MLGRITHNVLGILRAGSLVTSARYCCWSKPESWWYTCRPCFAEAPQRRSRQVPKLGYARSVGTV